MKLDLSYNQTMFLINLVADYVQSDLYYKAAKLHRLMVDDIVDTLEIYIAERDETK